MFDLVDLTVECHSYSHDLAKLHEVLHGQVPKHLVDRTARLIHQVKDDTEDEQSVDAVHGILASARLNRGRFLRPVQ